MGPTTSQVSAVITSGLASSDRFPIRVALPSLPVSRLPPLMMATTRQPASLLPLFARAVAPHEVSSNSLADPKLSTLLLGLHS
ncbi:hypothetical protein B296_00041760 [Ensete ventricosum]|uniref:Uncharacterized protein n=1 Tax=Ensete ventricosum TaxID=4639 RepID=A0A426ZKP9_ENSVE|nr:hypothetical protein B296_00041760 [Ensete ventricosum]